MTSTKHISKTLVVFLSAVTLGAVVITGSTRLRADEPQPSSGSPSLHDLEQQHIETLREMVKLATQLYNTGAGTLEDVDRANRELVETELKYANSSQERVQILTDAVAMAKDQEKTTNQMARVGAATSIAGLEVKAYRLDLEVRLAKETAK